MVTVVGRIACLGIVCAGALLGNGREVYLSNQSSAGALSLKFDGASPEGPAVVLKVLESQFSGRTCQEFRFQSPQDEHSVRAGELVELTLDQDGGVRSRRFQALQAGTGARFRFDVALGEERKGGGAATLVPVPGDAEGLDLHQELDDTRLIFFGPVQ